MLLLYSGLAQARPELAINVHTHIISNNLLAQQNKWSMQCVPDPSSLVKELAPRLAHGWAHGTTYLEPTTSLIALSQFIMLCEFQFSDNLSECQHS